MRAAASTFFELEQQQNRRAADRRGRQRPQLGHFLADQQLRRSERELDEDDRSIRGRVADELQWD
jgi:hypothetical protein